MTKEEQRRWSLKPRCKLLVLAGEGASLLGRPECSSVCHQAPVRASGEAGMSTHHGEWGMEQTVFYKMATPTGTPPHTLPTV